MSKPKPVVVEIEDAFGNKITLKNGKITIRSISIIELEAPLIILNGRPVAPGVDPI